MDFNQEKITTLHEISGATVDVSLDSVAVIVPMIGRELEGESATSLLNELEDEDIGRVVVPFYTDPEHVAAFQQWLRSFSLPIQPLWCGGRELERLLEANGLAGRNGKGRDVWLALGIAKQDFDYLVQNDADVKNYSPLNVRRLAFPLQHGCEFSKGYYARVEQNTFYGRLYRLFYRPLVVALSDMYDHDVLTYLEQFRYALSGEFGMTAEFAERIEPNRHMGFAVGTLGDAYRIAGFSGTAQANLGVHKHYHRPVGGDDGLSNMSKDISRAIFQILDICGISVDYEPVKQEYRTIAKQFVEQYALDAKFNNFEYDEHSERSQIDRYADAIGESRPASRLPAWREAPISPQDVLEAIRDDMQAAGVRPR